ncbi:MAG: lyase family protein, partial [Terriglobia bacterium]
MRRMRARTEHDSLGNVEVPAQVYYGAQTVRALRNYPISGLRAHPVFVKAYGLLKLACAEANLALGMIPPRVGRAIIRAARDVALGALHDQFPVDVYQAGAGVSFHMNVNEVIANRAIEYLGGKRGDYSVVHPND